MEWISGNLCHPVSACKLNCNHSYSGACGAYLPMNPKLTSLGAGWSAGQWCKQTWPPQICPPVQLSGFPSCKYWYVSVPKGKNDSQKALLLLSCGSRWRTTANRQLSKIYSAMNKVNLKQKQQQQRRTENCTLFKSRHWFLWSGTLPSVARSMFCEYFFPVK